LKWPSGIIRILANPTNKNKRLLYLFRGILHFVKRIKGDYYVTLDNGITCKVYADNPQSSELLIFNFQSEEHKFLHDVIKKDNISFLDIGANVGSFTVKYLHYVGQGNRAVLFEPNPFLTDRLNQLNGKYNVQVFPFALGRESKTMYLESESETSPCAKLVEKQTDIRVTVKTLDEMVEFLPAHVYFIKIDVEGYEYDVLVGGKEYIRRANPHLILFEYNDLAQSNGVSIQDFHILFNEMGYKVFAVADGELVPPQQKGKISDLLAIRDGFQNKIDHNQCLNY